MGGPMHTYQTDERHDTGEPVLCCDCEDAVAIPGMEGRCEDCHTNACEAADEQFYADFHGGACSQSVYDATYARKR